MARTNFLDSLSDKKFQSNTIREDVWECWRGISDDDDIVVEHYCRSCEKWHDVI